MKHRIAAALCLAVAILALGAAAARASVPTPEVEADYGAALAWWDVASPPQCKSVTLEMGWTDPEGEGALARSTMPQPGESKIACRIRFYKDEFATLSSCTKEAAVRHEVGHLLGLDHASDPTSIMAEAISEAVWCPEVEEVVVPATTPAPNFRESIPIACEALCITDLKRGKGTWTSRYQFTPAARVVINVFVGGRQIPLQTVKGCHATYGGRGAVLRMAICEPGMSHLRVRSDSPAPVRLLIKGTR